MKYKKLLSTLCLTLFTGYVWAQAPSTYYQKANGKKGAELKTAMFEIIRNPSVVDFDSLWTAYNTSDVRTDGNDDPFIWDMYSGISRYHLYDYPHGTGAGNTEGVKGIQREHSIAKSWLNPKDAPASGSKTYLDVRPMYSDLVHVIPVDAVCANNRSNLCYGEIDADKVDWSSMEEFCKKSKQGGCSTPGWREQVSDPSKTRVFEPNDEYKGDFARIFFYMVTCYQPGYLTWMPERDADKRKTGENMVFSSDNHCGTWTSDMFNQGDDDAYKPFAPWAFDMLMRWAKNDPVSQKEIDRNEVIWQLQGNRNPFVDYPGLEEYIWGDKKNEAFDYGGEPAGEELTSWDCEFALNKETLGVDWSETENLRNYWTRTPITFEKNGITFTFSNGMNGMSLYADDNAIRLYNYNTLTITAHNNEITKVEFTVSGQNHDNKTLVASVGDMADNVWTGEAEEVTFASNFVSSIKVGGVAQHYYLELSNIKVTMAKELTAEITGGEYDGGYWATYYNSFQSYVADNNTTVYAGRLSADNSELLLTEVRDKIINPREAVLLKSTAAKITLTPTDMNGTYDYSGNSLSGMDNATVAPTNQGTIYTLSIEHGKLAFRKFVGNKLEAHKAYLAINSTSDAPIRVSFGGETTGIEELTIDNSHNGYYTIDGQHHVGMPTTKGIYIINGQKVLIK